MSHRQIIDSVNICNEVERHWSDPYYIQRNAEMKNLKKKIKGLDILRSGLGLQILKNPHVGG